MLLIHCQTHTQWYWTNIVLLDMGTDDTGPGDALTYKSVAAGMIVPPNISDPAVMLSCLTPINNIRLLQTISLNTHDSSNT